MQNPKHTNARYDLDMSGTLNSNEELYQLTTNLTVKLTVKSRIQNKDIPAVSEMNVKIDKVGLDDHHSWTLKEFQQWYLNEILPDLCPA